ncbi:MAG: SLBB domain-containing protein [Bacteroidota bacterium]
MNIYFKVLMAVCVVFVTSMLPSGAFAQTSESGLGSVLPRAATASYYYIGKPGELTMQVNLWGFVKNPGRYEVPSSTDLVQLVSYAGGPVQGADMDDVRITRFNRTDSLLTRGEYSVNLAELYRVDPAKLVLRPGDTVFIDHSNWLTVRDVFSVITTAAIITSAVAQIINVTNR